MSTPLPRPPFTSWPVQVYDPAFGFIWYVSPGVLVDQAIVPNATAAIANQLHDWIDRVVLTRGDELRSVGGLVIVHDWRLLRGYDKDARVEFVARMRRRKKGYLRRALTIVDPGASPLLRMAIQATNLFTTMSLAAPVEVREDAEAVVAELGLRPPLPGAKFPT